MMRCVVALVLALLVSGCGAPIAAPTTAVPVDQQRRYHDGQRWITVTVLLDRLFVERGTAGAITGREVYLLRTPVVSVAALEDVARQMRAAQPDIRNLSAFIEESRPSGIRRERLTRQVAVRGGQGVDLSTLVIQQGARVVRTFDDSPDIVIAESPASDLLAAFSLAERLRTSAGVVAAIPVGE
jgi:hypothetical protein